MANIHAYVAYVEQNIYLPICVTNYERHSICRESEIQTQYDREYALLSIVHTKGLGYRDAE